MPQRHRIKTYVKDGYYHVYNRGVEKRKIFLDKQDYNVFLSLLKYYLSPSNQSIEHPLTGYDKLKPIRIRPLTNISSEVDLLAYCLMPNHFHLLLKQKTKDGMTKLMRRVSTVYAMYFNKRYNRVGTLFQGRYKAALITKDTYLLHISRYIHLNPAELSVTGTDPVNYPYSSYKYYLREKHADWLKPDFILEFFINKDRLPFLLSYPSYSKFLEQFLDKEESLLGKLILE
jgi:putative transposase